MATTVSDHAVALTADGLLDRSGAQLDALFRASPAGEVPRGDSQGTVIACPGTALARPIDRILRLLAWQGKVFDPATRTLKNKILPFGLRAVPAETYLTESWVDGEQCVVLDYSRTSKVAGWVRDEIREVSPGVYLGVVWAVGRVFGGRRRVLRFALTFPPDR